MKSILISINPPFSKQIMAGEKTVEIRKRKPSLYLPFKCYLYETRYGGGCGMVIGQFTVYAIECFKRENLLPDGTYRHILDAACLRYEQIEHYAGNDELYGWHISDVKPCRRNVGIERFRKTNGERYKRLPVSYGYCENNAIDFIEITTKCHWSEGITCGLGRECHNCKHQPPDDEKQNGKEEPTLIAWEADPFGGEFPKCPSCGEMPHSLDRCVFCGQRFIKDDRAIEW